MRKLLLGILMVLPVVATGRRYIRRSEMARIYEDRETKARDMVLIAGEALEKGKVDMALQYYYWDYSLIRSVQLPNMSKIVATASVNKNMIDFFNDYHSLDGWNCHHCLVVRHHYCGIYGRIKI